MLAGGCGALRLLSLECARKREKEVRLLCFYPVLPLHLLEGPVFKQVVYKSS